MKDYKLLLAGLTLLLLIILIGIFTWLWSSNRKNMDPLPIMASEGASAQPATDFTDNKDTVATSILYIQAEDKLQTPLDDVIVRFESRYPHVQVLAHYVPAKALFALPDTSISDKERSPFIVNIDVVIADDKMPQTGLSHLQSLLDNAQSERNLSQMNGVAQNNQNTVNADPAASIGSHEARHLASFSYALKGKQAVDGVILTDNPIAVNFRNFLLSSAGQDILEKYDYDNIDGYKNSMDDLFNPTSRAKTATEEPSIKVTDALSNGK